MKLNFVYQIKDNFIDLSQIKTFRLIKYSNETENRILEIQLKDRIHFFNNDRDDYQLIPEEIQIIFPDSKIASSECYELSKAWEEFICKREAT